MSNTAIKVENLSKRYRIGLKEEIHDTMVGAITDFVKRPIKNLKRLRKLSTFSKNGNESEDIIWALKDVSFEINHGEVVGIIGRNGAGKSTLLKIISHITEPTFGSVTFNGRVSSLLEVGTGFHAELTGRENVYLNGTILGMSKTEIDRKFDEIVAFSEVERFLDTPVKRYSSGMKVRLAFAVAAHLEPEILLIDEVLAVGDSEFQKKCLGKMDSIAGEGRTILFVSHNLTMLQRLCPEAMLLESGRFIDRDESSAIVQKYLGFGTSDVGERSWTWGEEQKKSLEPFIPLNIRVKDHNNNISERINSSQPFNIEMEYEITRSVSNLKIGVTLSTGTGERFCVCWDNNANQRKPGIYLSRCEIPANLFSHGGFILGLISGIPGAQKLFRDFELLTFYIDSDTEISRMGRSILRPEFKWDTESIRK